VFLTAAPESGAADRKARPGHGRHWGRRSMQSGILQAINGISFAALLFLLASGFTLSFGLMRVVNMAHGAYYLFGGYVGLSITRYTGSFALGVLGGGLAVIPLGYLIDRFLIRRTGENHLAQVLLTVGIAFVMGDIALKIWGGDNLKVPTPIAMRGAIELPGGIIYPTYRLMLIGFGIVVALSLWLLYRKTQIGAVVRAGVDDREIVSAMGINIDRLFVLVSALASFLAGIAGVAGGAFLTLYPGAEWEILIYALVVVIFGGLGSLEGAMIGALLVGLLDAYGRWLLPEFSYFVLFGPMAILLLFRPRGIFGREG
jgi:branched-chain amino acid transport system permease protein